MQAGAQDPDQRPGRRAVSRRVWSIVSTLVCLEIACYGQECAMSSDPLPQVVIRPPRPEDVEGMYRLRLMRGSLDYTLALPSERLDGSRRRVEGLGPDDHTFVAVLDGVVVGMCGL